MRKWVKEGKVEEVFDEIETIPEERCPNGPNRMAKVVLFYTLYTAIKKEKEAGNNNNKLEEYEKKTLERIRETWPQLDIEG